jgi:hypothetical protein
MRRTGSTRQPASASAWFASIRPLSGDPPDTGVEVFFVSDGWLVYLKPVGAAGRSQTVEMGSVGAIRA